MYKRIISLFLALLMICGLCACGRKNPSTLSQSYTPAGQAVTPAETAVPEEAASESATPSPVPTLTWVESEDGQSISAAITGINGETAEIAIGITGGENQDITDSSLPLDTSTTVPQVTPTVEIPAPTAPAEPQAPVTNWTGPATETTLAQYEAMSGDEQMLFYYSFASAADFNAWYAAAKAAAEANRDYIEIGADGTVSLN